MQKVASTIQDESVSVDRLHKPNTVIHNEHMKKTFFKNALAVLMIAVAAVVVLMFTVVCSGWSEGDGTGECMISQLTPLYNTIMGILLIAAFSAILWVPVVTALVLLVGFVIKKFSKK